MLNNNFSLEFRKLREKKFLFNYLSGLYSDSSAMLFGVLRSKLVPLTGVFDLFGVRTVRLNRGVDEVSI